MNIQVLGTGTSQGVPVIGCDCEACQSTDSRDKRLRVAVLISKGEQRLVIDVGPDFRQQMLSAGVSDLDAVLLTHEHNDHMIGIDDLRPFVFRSLKPMPIYCSDLVATDLRERFAYAFKQNPYPGAPRFELSITDSIDRFSIGSLEIDIIRYLHGKTEVQGYRIGSFAYLTDIKTISDTELNKVKGVSVLIISALQHEHHHSHASLSEALALIEKIQPQQAFLTHLSHKMGTHAAVEKMLPHHVHIAYDGLELSVDDK